MNLHRLSIFAIVLLCALSFAAQAQPKITIDRNTGATATGDFKFKRVPSPVRADAAGKARVSIVDGEPDPNSADVSALVDGVLPNSEDQPRRNFFFNAGSGGGRLRIDLGEPIQIAQINSYSWHPNSRGPQVYRVWGSDGTDRRFNAEPKANIDPRSCGWKSIAIVDTRSNDDDGGQFGVSISDESGSLGTFRYLLFDCYVTEVADDFGKTFYSEIDVITKM